jgi:hypothetical protein
MKNLKYFIVLILIVAGSVYVLKPHPAALESEYLEFRLGAKPSPEMKATEETLLFKTNGEIYYSIFSKKPFGMDGSIEVFVKNTADLSKVLFTEELGTVDKKIARPINPVKSEIAGDYLIEIVKDGMPIARKMFTISGDVQAAAAPAPAPMPSPAAPASGEVKIEAPAAPATVEVKVEAPVVPAAPATVEVKTGL